MSFSQLPITEIIRPLLEDGGAVVHHIVVCVLLKVNPLNRTSVLFFSADHLFAWVSTMLCVEAILIEDLVDLLKLSSYPLLIASTVSVVVVEEVKVLRDTSCINQEPDRNRRA